MQKIQELVKEGKLTKNLMSDKEFVDGAKEIFKSEKIEMDDEKLKQLMDQIEAQLKRSEIMSDKELESVSGGMDWEATGKSAARKTIKTVTSVAGIAVGFCVGAHTGLHSTKKVMGTGKQQSATKLELTVMQGGAVLGGAGLGYVGYKLGEWICKKAGLEEA